MRFLDARLAFAGRRRNRFTASRDQCLPWARVYGLAELASARAQQGRDGLPTGLDVSHHALLAGTVGEVAQLASRRRR